MHATEAQQGMLWSRLSKKDRDVRRCLEKLDCASAARGGEKKVNTREKGKGPVGCIRMRKLGWARRWADIPSRKRED